MIVLWMVAGIQLMLQGLTKTQVRRLQRKHTLQCYKAGALQRAAHTLECQLFDEMVSSEEASSLIHSVSIHRADCQQLNAEVHYANTSNCLAAENGHKSKATFKLHRSVHKEANEVKHGRLNVVLGPCDLPPVPPPAACSRLVVGSFGGEVISCTTLEKQLIANAARPKGVACNACGLWNPVHYGDTNALRTTTAGIPFKPYSGSSFNLSAKEFVPAGNSSQGTRTLDAKLSKFRCQDGDGEREDLMDLPYLEPFARSPKGFLEQEINILGKHFGPTGVADFCFGSPSLMAESLDTSPIAVSNNKIFHGCHHDSDENRSDPYSLTGDSESEHGSTTGVLIDCTLPDPHEQKRRPTMPVESDPNCDTAKDLEVKVCIPPGCVLEVNLERARNFGDRQDFSNDGGAVPYDCKQQ